MNINFKTAALGAAAICLAACATPQEDANAPRGIAAFADHPRLGEEVSKVCFAQTIDGFSNNTKDTVVLRKGVSEEYIVEMYGSCFPLRDAQRIGIASYTSCLTPYDDLVVSDSLFGSGAATETQRCAIRKIHRWLDPQEVVASETEDPDT